MTALTTYSESTKLIPLIPLGVSPRIVVIKSIFSNLLVHIPSANPVITNVKVIKIAALYKVYKSTIDSLVKLVPIIVPSPNSNKVLVPFGHSLTAILPLMLSMLAPIKAPASCAAVIQVFKAKAPKIPPTIK